MNKWESVTGPKGNYGSKTIITEFLEELSSGLKMLEEKILSIKKDQKK